jgi:hypothetical protein
VGKDEFGNALLQMSEATRDAYRIAVNKGHHEIAADLRKLAEQQATIIAKALRGELARVS